MAATPSWFVGEGADGVIIGLITATSVGLGFVKEYRADRPATDRTSNCITGPSCAATGTSSSRDLADPVHGDLVRVQEDSVVPADLRLTACNGPECNESVLSSELTPASPATARSATASPATPRWRGSARGSRPASQS
jgi:P-type Mg2+ transporter